MKTQNILMAAGVLFTSFQLKGNNPIQILQDTAKAQEEKKEITPKINLIIQSFGDYYYVMQSDTFAIKTSKAEFAKSIKHQQAFSIRRLYFGGQVNFNEKFSFRSILEGDDKSLLGDGKRGVFIKVMEFAWKDVIKGIDFMAGLHSTPAWVLFTEKWWTYRSIEKTIFDLRGLSSAVDLGFSIIAKIHPQFLNLHFAVGNGTFTKPENNSAKRFYLAINGNPLGILLYDIYTDYEYQKKDAYNLSFKGFLGITTKYATVGIEAGEQIQQKGIKKDSLGNKIGIIEEIPGSIAIWARGQIIKDLLYFFLRYDYFDPDFSSGSSGYIENLIIAGLDIKLMKNASLMPNIWITTYKKEDAKLPSHKEIIVPRVTYFWKF